MSDQAQPATCEDCQAWGLIADEVKLCPLHAQAEALLEALKDIAKGMAPPEVMRYLELESPEQFRGRMWGWSEKRAEAAIAAARPQAAAKEGAG
jgi:hypothetical protein